MKIYYPHIDGLKGLAILLMVMAHALAWSYTDSHFLSQRFCDMIGNEFNASFIWKFIYSFHMPLLFSVSGFLFYKPIEYTWEKTLSVLNKRVLRIFVPYLVTGVFVFFLKGYFGYWFLQILFILNCIFALESMFLFYTRATIRTELLTHIAVYCILFVGCKLLGRVSLPQELHNLHGLDGYYLVFVLGYLLRKYPRMEEFISVDKWSFGAFILFVSLFAVINSNLHIPFVGTFVPVAAIMFLWQTLRRVNYEMGGVKYLLT